MSMMSMRTGRTISNRLPRRATHFLVFTRKIGQGSVILTTLIKSRALLRQDSKLALLKFFRIHFVESCFGIYPRYSATW